MRGGVLLQVGVLISACLLLSACASSEERLDKLSRAMIDGGYATSFEPTDQGYLDRLESAGLGVSDGCMSIIEITDRERLVFASETGMLATEADAASLAMDSDGNTAVNGRFILVKSLQDGEYCATLYGDYLEDRPSPEMDARHDEAARYFRSIG